MGFLDIALSSIGLIMIAMMIFFCICAAVSMSKMEEEISVGEALMLIPCMFISLIIVFGMLATVGYLLRSAFCFFTGIGCF